MLNFTTSASLSITQRLSLTLLLSLFLLQLGCTHPAPSQDRAEPPIKAGNGETGEFVWHDLLTGEPDVAKQFYGGLFGWDFETTGRSTLITLDQRAIGSIMEMPATDTRHVARWVASLGVADIAKATEWTLQQGGSVHEGPRYMRNRGEIALVSDSLGAQIGLIELGPKKTITPVSVAINDWLWDELWTTNIDQALKFYSGLYEFEATEATPGYWILKSGEKWRGGIRELFDRDLEQRWVPVIRVNDTRAVSERAQVLGAKIILAAEQREAGDETALLADPGGALFMIQEWSNKDVLEGGRNE